MISLKNVKLVCNVEASLRLIFYHDQTWIEFNFTYILRMRVTLIWQGAKLEAGLSILQLLLQSGSAAAGAAVAASNIWDQIWKLIVLS